MQRFDLLLQILIKTCRSRSKRRTIIFQKVSSKVSKFTIIFYSCSHEQYISQQFNWWKCKHINAPCLASPLTCLNISFFDVTFKQPGLAPLRLIIPSLSSHAWYSPSFLAIAITLLPIYYSSLFSLHVLTTLTCGLRTPKAKREPLTKKTRPGCSLGKHRAMLACRLPISSQSRQS